MQRCPEALELWHRRTEVEEVQAVECEYIPPLRGTRWWIRRARMVHRNQELMTRLRARKMNRRAPTVQTSTEVAGVSGRLWTCTLVLELCLVDG